MSEHTKGPWIWDEVPLPGLGPHRFCQVLNAGSGRAVLRHEASGGPIPWRVAPEDQALISKAWLLPEMVEALREMRSSCLCIPEMPCDTCSVADNVLAKYEAD